LLETVRLCWPEPFAVAPPCCATLSHDEATLLVMIGTAGDGRRPIFDALLCEMLGQDACDRLYAASAALASGALPDALPMLGVGCLCARRLRGYTDVFLIGVVRS
ncbi:UNVERIFIED_CONTAM: hypothetical protein IGO34_26215, partial [Salmonella enterica subsp. enterica serovar Weltevreden]